jgi:formate transporter
MYFIPVGLLLKEEPQVVAATGKVVSDLGNLNLQGFVGNLISVTTGNIFGGGFMVAVVYWFVYRRPREAGTRFGAKQVLELFLASPAAQKSDPAG